MARYPSAVFLIVLDILSIIDESSDGEGDQMPAVKLVPDAKIEEMQTLRRRGFTIRTIARLLEIPRATVHHYVRHERVNSNAAFLSEKARDVDHLGIYLPYRLVCPSCGLEQPGIVFCINSGVVWMGECGHGGAVVGNRHQGIDLKDLERRPGDGRLSLVLLEPDDHFYCGPER